MAMARLAVARYRHGLAPRPGRISVVVPEIAGALAKALPKSARRSEAGWPQIVTTAAAAKALSGPVAWVDDINLLRHIGHQLDLYLLRFDPDGLTDPDSHIGRSVRLGTGRLLTNTILMRQTSMIERLHQPWLSAGIPGWAQGPAAALRAAVYRAEAPASPPRTPSGQPVDGPAPHAFVQPLRSRLHLAPQHERAQLDRPIGVFLHLYYDELAETFAQRLRLIDHPTTIYISTDTQDKADRIASALPEAVIRVTANRGRDIRPKLYTFADAYDEHDVVLHLHGKRSLHAGELDLWLAEIVDSLLTSTEAINRILDAFHTIPQLGILAPRPLEWVLPSYGWGNNRYIGEIVAWQAGLLPLPADDLLRFPAGSMFWAQSRVLKPLVDLHLTESDFPPEQGQLDATLAHTLERLIGVSCLNQGLDYVAYDGRSPFDNGDDWTTFDDSDAMGAFRARYRTVVRRADEPLSR